MNITVIHGQMHKGSTYHIAEAFTDKIKTMATVEKVEEFYLPKDGPDFCVGCYQCFYQGESLCPHSTKVLPIIASMEKADIILLESPNYVFDVTGQMKVLLDHFGFMWLSHRPNETMFQKQGIVISTAAGAGARKVAKNLKKQLFWLGVSNVHTIAFNVNASKWSEVKEKIRKKIAAKVNKVALVSLKKVGKIKPALLEKMMFRIMRGMQKSNDWNLFDHDYWLEKGWLDKKRPWL